MHERLCKWKKTVKSEEQKKSIREEEIQMISNYDNIWSISASHRVRKSLTWSIDFIPTSTGEDITCILCIELILGQLSINYNELRGNPLESVHLECSVWKSASCMCYIVAHATQRSSGEQSQLHTSAKKTIQKKKKEIELLMVSLQFLIAVIYKIK